MYIVKRVVHVTTVHHLHDPRIFYKQCQSLHKAGYEVHLIVQHAQSEVLEGVHIEALPMVGKNRWRRLGLQHLVYQKALALAADLYHIHDPELIPLAYRLKRQTGACIIYDMHEDYLAHGRIQGRLLRLLERWCFGWMEHIVVANAMQKRIAMGGNVTVIANHFKPAEPAPPIQALPADSEPLRLLYTGVIAGVRGLFDMIELAKAIKEQQLPWQIDLVGVVYIEADRERAEALMQSYGVEEIIYRMGWETFVPFEQMVPYYREAHVGLALLHPQASYMATIPTKFFEYTYYGLPIVCSGFPGWKAFLKRHHCGIAVENRSPGNVIEAIQTITSTSLHYRRVAEDGQHASKQYYLWEATAKELVGVYKKLIG